MSETLVGRHASASPVSQVRQTERIRLSEPTLLFVNGETRPLGHAACGGLVRAMVDGMPIPPVRTPQDLNEAITGGIGDSPLRPDGTLKVRGEYAYSSDLWAEDMLWGATLRSPHPYARITSIDIGPALKHPGVYAVLTHKDIPGENIYGLKVSDTPVLAEDVVRYQGEPVALVAAGR